MFTVTTHHLVPDTDYCYRNLCDYKRMNNSYLTKTFDGCRGYSEHLFEIIMCKQIMILKQWITWLFFTSCIIRSFPRVLLCRKEASSLPKTSYWPTLVTFLTLINRIKIEERREDLIRNLKYLWRSRLYFNWTFSTESLFFRFSKSVLKRSIRTTRSNIFWSN